jgi:hypothetical protein
VTVDRLRRYDLTYPDRTEQSLRQESEAREELALDLGLSIDVFSPQPISKPAIDILSRAAEAMSLADEPPLIHFGYLRPISKRAADHYAKGDPEPGEASEAELTTPLGVRLLLKEWETGTNPRDYIYKDPYDDTSVPDILPRQRTTLRPPVAAQNLPITRSQRPPSIVTSQPPFVQPGRTTMTNIYDVPYGDSQQTAVGGPEISTQVPPGPYGGRPMGRKRQAKKRLDGF